MVRAVITDVDGVLVGTKEGGYFPNPSPTVTEAIRKISRSIPVVLCSGKPNFGLVHIVKLMELNNLHIASNGAVLFNPFDGTMEVESIPNDFALSILSDLYTQGIDADFITDSGFFHDRKNESPFIPKLASARFTEPVIVDDMESEITKHTIVRIDAYAEDHNRTKVEEVLKPFANRVEIHWTTVQFDPTRIGLITRKGFSKSTAVRKVSDKLGIPLSDILGIGDGMNDWDFIRHCGYAGIMGNADPDLKRQALSFGDRQTVGGHVDQDGVIHIFKKFSLL